MHLPVFSQTLCHFCCPQLINGVTFIEHIAEKEQNNSETEGISTRPIVQLMTTECALSQGNLFVRKCANWLNFSLHYTNIDHLYKIPSTAGSIPQTHKLTHLFLPPVFLFLILDAYCNLFYLIPLSFSLFIQFLVRLY
jgi:hypothetical protein